LEVKAVKKSVYTIREVAQMMGIAEGTVRKMVHDNQIPSFRPSPRRIIIPAAAFEKWLEEQVHAS